MSRLLRCLFPPLLALALAMAGYWGLGMAAAGIGEWAVLPRALLETAVWLAAAWLLVRLLDALLWQGLLARRRGRPMPRLLKGLAGLAVWLAAGLIIAGQVFAVPLTGILTTSGVAVAVLGFALRDMLASLFAGIALGLEGPYQIGDWLELEPGVVGRVEQVGWLTTRLRRRDNATLVLPNAELATRRFSNHHGAGHRFRDSFPITLDHGLDPERVERVLLAAAAEIAPGSPRPDLRIEEFGDNGVRWLLRYWLEDYAGLPASRYAVQRAVLRHLAMAGIPLPYAKRDLFHARMPARELAYELHLDRLLARCELFADLAAEDLRELAAAARRRRVPAGETVVREGEAGASLFIVMEGVFEARILRPDGREAALGTLVAGDMFGEFSLLTGAPRSATVRARTGGVLMEIGREAMAPILRRCPELAERLSAVLARRQDLLRGFLREAEGEPVAAHPAASGLLERMRRLFGL